MGQPIRSTSPLNIPPLTRTYTPLDPVGLFLSPTRARDAHPLPCGRGVSAASEPHFSLALPCAVLQHTVWLWPRRPCLAEPLPHTPRLLPPQAGRKCHARLTASSRGCGRLAADRRSRHSAAGSRRRPLAAHPGPRCCRAGRRPRPHAAGERARRSAGAGNAPPRWCDYLGRVARARRLRRVRRRPPHPATVRLSPQRGARLGGGATTQPLPL